MLLAALLGFAMPTSAAGSDDTPRRTLRVGFYTYTGYHVMDEDGHRSGYSYEVLQRIAQHENVQFEYLAYDCDANEAADMLERGEIDLLPTLRKTDERAERFAGESKYPLKKMIAFAADGITSFRSSRSAWCFPRAWWCLSSAC